MNALNVYLALATMGGLASGGLAFIIGITTGSWSFAIQGVVYFVVAIIVGNVNRSLQEKAMGKERYHGRA